MSQSLVGGGGHAPLFTVSQLAEMEHQALVFKYLKAGLPVPPDLLAPIRSSFNLIHPDFLRHPSLTYASFCGKKIDPEPGRCRRTDGKKWRCSKDAHPDSKYCERHMNRGRYRSRKLVESQNASQSLSAVASSDIRTGSSGHSGTFLSMPLQSAGNSGNLCFGGDVSELKMEPVPYGIVKHGNRVLDGAEEHNFMSEASGSARSVGVASTVDSPWRLMTSQVPLNSSSEPRNGSFLLNNSQMQTLQDSEALTVDSAMSKQQQQQYVGGEFGVLRSIKQEQHPLQPFFDEWPKSRDLGFQHTDPRSTNNLSNTPQLSMSNLMAPSKFFKER
ncbi:growth-regulating factor 5-like [Argentina anserina]|uniref:growth-regulating factor 5-like n=1 Tax=Argentina anserina TaxID=57926 RepID=UPI0021764C49|nr:growth-regulating factor 5-like [Potentilla anserina]